MKHRAKAFWLFGRSGAGKTTLARLLKGGFEKRNIPVLLLDGDDVRSGLCSDLGFTNAARLENHRRIAEVARLAVEQGFNVLAATMAPGHDQREVVASVLGETLVWIYVDAPLEVCIRRDPKGLYARAREGELDDLLEFPFDLPRPHEGQNCIDTVTQSVEECYEILEGKIWPD